MKAEKEKAEEDAAKKEEATKLHQEMEGDPDCIEEDLSQPALGQSRKRPADEVAAEEDHFTTPKRPKSCRLSPKRSIFTKVVKYNVKDKKQIYFDLRLTRLLISQNCGFTGLASTETLQFCEDFMPQYHIKNPSTFTRYTTCHN